LLRLLKAPPVWPKTIGGTTLTEEYSDIPWTQKLGTYTGNEINEALVLPFNALSGKNTSYCGTLPKVPGVDPKARCMIETGINSILNIVRTETLYNPNDSTIAAATRCKPGSTNFSQPCPQTTKNCPDSSVPNSAPLPCVQVVLALSMYGTTPTLAPMDIGTNPQDDRNPGGYVINEGTTYAPQMPWYMSHYCQSDWSTDRKDPTCYADYLSTFNAGFSGALDAWPKAMAWSVLSPNALNLCKPGPGPSMTACIFAMAGFDLADPVPPQSPVAMGPFQYQNFNGYLFNWFNNALTGFPNNLSPADLKLHFPWDNPFNDPTGRTKLTWATTLYPHSFRNPFLGQYTYRQTVPNNPNCTYILPPNTPIGPVDNCVPSEDRADHFLYPRQCSLADLVGTDTNVARLRQCGLSYEIHHNGWVNQWPAASWLTNAMFANQYGRTTFLFAGVHGMQLPVSFYKDPIRCPELCPSTARTRVASVSMSRSITRACSACIFRSPTKRI
jgi:hypothetical protein